MKELNKAEKIYFIIWTISVVILITIAIAKIYGMIGTVIISGIFLIDIIWRFIADKRKKNKEVE